MKYKAIPDPIEIVEMAYWVFLQREIDEIGRATWLDVIASGNFSHQALIKDLTNSLEYKLLNKTPPLHMLHMARQAWIKTVPTANKILDIGGSSPTMAEGALIELGYLYRPEELVILDLPIDKQYWGKPKFSQDRPYSFSWGIVKYIHEFGENIDSVKELENESFDMVFMGQAIEHLHPEALPKILRWIKCHLNQNGLFVFDTPNRLLTRLQCPDRYVDDDHKIEYIPSDLRNILIEAGFLVIKETGIMLMPRTVLTNCFDITEFYDQNFLSEKVDDAYLFAFECIKQ